MVMGEKVFFRRRPPRANRVSHRICLQKGIGERAKLIASALIRHLPFAAVARSGELACFLPRRGGALSSSQVGVPWAGPLLGAGEAASILLSPPRSVLPTLGVALPQATAWNIVSISA